MTLKKIYNLPSFGVSQKGKTSKKARRQHQMKRDLKKKVTENRESLCGDSSVANLDNIVPDKNDKECSKNDNTVEIPVEKTYSDVEVQVETLFIKLSFIDFTKTEQDLMMLDAGDLRLIALVDINCSNTSA